MDTKFLLIAASTLVLAACGGAEVDTADAEYEDGAVETALSDEQPPLEGDSPFVDAEDVAESRSGQDGYDAGFGGDLDDDADETRLSDAFADADTGLDTGFDTATSNLIAESERVAADARAEMDEAEDGLEGYAAAARGEGERMAAGAERRASDLAATVTDGVSAKRYTANNTDAYINDEGELITGSEASALSGSWAVTMPDGNAKTLVIDGKGDMATGIFDGAPIEVAVTGRNFSFDAPMMMEGEEQLMTFAGTFENGMIENGVIEAQGDGGTTTFTAERVGEPGVDDPAYVD